MVDYRYLSLCEEVVSKKVGHDKSITSSYRSLHFPVGRNLKARRLSMLEGTDKAESQLQRLGHAAQ